MLTNSFLDKIQSYKPNIIRTESYVKLCQFNKTDASLFDEPSYYDEEDANCVREDGEMQSYGNSSEKFWTELEKRKQPTNLETPQECLEIGDP